MNADHPIPRLRYDFVAAVALAQKGCGRLALGLFVPSLRGTKRERNLTKGRSEWTLPRKTSG